MNHEPVLGNSKDSPSRLKNYLILKRLGNKRHQNISKNLTTFVTSF